MGLRRWAFLVSLVSCGGSCVSGDGLQTELRNATTEYNRSLRWGDFDRAAEHLPVKSQQAFLEQHEAVREELVIVDYEVTRLDLDAGTGVATSRAEVSWHTDRQLVLKTTEVEQVWQFFAGQFVLVDEHRKHGTPLTVFADPAETPHPYLPGLEVFRKEHSIGPENQPEKKHRRRKGKNAEPPSSGAPSNDTPSSDTPSNDTPSSDTPSSDTPSNDGTEPGSDPNTEPGTELDSNTEPG